MEFVAKIQFSELLDAFQFVSFGAPFEHSAYINPETGTIFYVSEGLDAEEEVPEDLETSDQYIAVPHKNDLNLGRNLALSFAEEELSGHYDAVAEFFRNRGAYRRFKDFLETHDRLEQWYAYEANATEMALRAWAEGEGIGFIDEQAAV